MKKILFSLTLFLSALLPLAAYATVFEHDLYSGMLSNPDVKSLQEFLHIQGFYNGPVTGNFLSQTKQALVKFQEKEGITPSNGYLGPKTRSLINTRTKIKILSNEDQMESLRSQIKTLQAQLANLIAQQRAVPSPTPIPSLTPTTTPVSSPLPSPTPLTPIATTTPSAPVAELRMSGSYTQPFPAIATSPLKLGDITISNTTNRVFLFNQIVLDIYDAMNSTLNRNKTVLFKLRDGTTTFNDLISETKFDINREPPRVGEETRRQVSVSFPRLIQPGQTYVSSLWIENLDYVISGSLRVQAYDVLVSDAPAPKGNFTFTLTSSP